MIYIISGIVFILMLGLLVLVHEAGHFFAAKTANVKVEEFGFGFPPKITSKQIGETEFSLNALPIGGFVRMLGQDDFNPDSHSDDKRSFEKAHPLWKIFISAAGVIMNIVLAVFLLWIGYMVGMNPILRGKLTNVIHGVVEESPAQQANLQKDDVLIAVNNISTNDPEAFAHEVSKYPQTEATVTIERNGELQNILVTPDKEGRIGIEISAIAESNFIRAGPIDAMGYAIGDVGNATILTVKGLWGLVEGIFTRMELSEDIGGPVRIAEITHRAVQVGWLLVLQIAALLSISLAVLNIAPFPALDGGHIIFSLIELFRGKPVNKKVLFVLQGAGMVLLLMLIAATVINDILRIIH